MSYLARVSKEIESPPPDATCEMKYGKGYNRGYEVGHGHAKCDAKTIARKADCEIEMLKAKIDILEKIRERTERGGGGEN